MCVADNETTVLSRRYHLSNRNQPFRAATRRQRRRTRRRQPVERLRHPRKLHPGAGRVDRLRGPGRLARRPVRGLRHLRNLRRLGRGGDGVAAVGGRGVNPAPPTTSAAAPPPTGLRQNRWAIPGSEIIMFQ